VSGDLDKRRLRQHVQLWARNGPFLEALRDREIRQADTAGSIRMFDLAFRIAVRDLPLRDSSGLVEWQNFLRRARRDG